MTRYWQAPEGIVYPGELTEPTRYTEVRVVPLDAVVIERSELPEVDPERSGFSGYVGLDGPGSVESAPVALMGSAESYRLAARRNLALAEYLTANPPIDEEQVSALAAMLRDALGVTPETVAAGHLRQGSSADVARALIATGKVTVTTDDGAS